jgi:hypothetical protein
MPYYFLNHITHFHFFASYYWYWFYLQNKTHIDYIFILKKSSTWAPHLKKLSKRSINGSYFVRHIISINNLQTVSQTNLLFMRYCILKGWEKPHQSDARGERGEHSWALVTPVGFAYCSTFVCFCQLVSNYRLIRFKRFVSWFSTKMCN